MQTPAYNFHKFGHFIANFLSDSSGASLFVKPEMVNQNTEV